MEASIVVEGDLGHDVVRPLVLVVVIWSTGSSHQGTVELVRVCFACVSKRSPIAGCWSRLAGSSLSLYLICNMLRIYNLVVGLLWEVVPIANDVAESAWVVAQHVSNLTAGICSVLCCLDPSIGCLLQKKLGRPKWSRTYPKADEGKVGRISVGPPLGPESLPPRRLLDC